MPDKAVEKSICANLWVVDINQPLARGIESHFAVISRGVFTTEHVGSERFGKLLADCEAGGYLAITVKTGIWQVDIHPYLHAPSHYCKVWVLDRTDPYVSMLATPNTVPSFAVVIEKLWDQSRQDQPCCGCLARQSSLCIFSS